NAKPTSPDPRHRLTIQGDRTMNAQTESVPRPARFTKIGTDGKPCEADHVAVADGRTGLMWAVKPIKVKNWKPATEEKIAAELAESRLAGFDDWRIPTVEELMLLADRTRHSPAIDQDFFPDTPSDWFWTCTPYAPDGDCAWVVVFGCG